MRPKLFLLVLAVCTLIQSQSHAGTPGIDEPLMTAIMPFRAGTTITEGVELSDIYMLQMEPTQDPSQPGNQSFVFMWADAPAVQWPATGPGPVYYPNRSLRYPKEELHYNAVDWRNGVLHQTYTVRAFVWWPAGFGAVSGNWYPSGSKFLDIQITIVP